MFLKDHPHIESFHFIFNFQNLRKCSSDLLNISLGCPPDVPLLQGIKQTSIELSPLIFLPIGAVQALFLENTHLERAGRLHPRIGLWGREYIGESCFHLCLGIHSVTTQTKK